LRPVCHPGRTKTGAQRRKPRKAKAKSEDAYFYTNIAELMFYFCRIGQESQLGGKRTNSWTVTTVAVLEKILRTVLKEVVFRVRKKNRIVLRIVHRGSERLKAGLSAFR